MKQIIYYKTKNGKCPYEVWFKKLDKSLQARIASRIHQREQGHYGDFKRLSHDLLELRLKFGAGYRIYFTEDEKTIIIILCAGDKSTQSKDIEKAKKIINEIKEE